MSLTRRFEITRLEAFSDAVFAFALTLLVVSLEVPHSYHELMTLVRGFLPFACSFALLIWIWYEHSAFFSAYPLHDALTAALNGVLLFVVLFYVYPLKFLFNLTFSMMMPELRHGGEAASGAELQNLFIVYGLGFIAVFGVFALLYWRAWKRRGGLGLSPLEAWDARGRIGTQLTSCAIGLISIAWVLLAPVRLRPFSGFVYFLMGPAHWAYGEWNGRRRKAFMRSLAPTART